MGEWTARYEADLLQALADASSSRDPRALSHRRAFGGNRWAVQDLGRYGFLRAGIPVASVHRAAQALMTKGLVARDKLHGANYYALTEAGKTRAGIVGDTRTGRSVTEREIEALAAEAERGYDVTRLTRREP